MDNNTINDIAGKLQDIKKDTITERRSEPQKLPIDTLIKYLKEQKARGAKNVYCNGTLYSDEGNYVLMSNEPQW